MNNKLNYLHEMLEDVASIIDADEMHGMQTIDEVIDFCDYNKCVTMNERQWIKQRYEDGEYK